MVYSEEQVTECFLICFGVVELSQLMILDGVKKSFGPRDVLKGVDLELEQGECLALLGPNGAGKSTAIRIALGLSNADQGRVELMGYSLPKQGHLARFEVGVVPQYDALDPDFTVLENLLVFARYFKIAGAEASARAQSLLEFSALTQRAQDSVSQLSGGMKRRLSLARALINRPKVVFLDEPTTALDPQAKHLIWERLGQLKREGIGLFLTTHFMDEAQRVADRVAVLDGGFVIEKGTPLELIARHVGGMVLEMWGSAAPAFLGHAGFLGSAERRGESFYLRDESARLAVAALEGAGPVPGHELSPDDLAKRGLLGYLYRPGNLEDVFFTLTGRDLRDD